MARTLRKGLIICLITTSSALSALAAEPDTVRVAHQLRPLEVTGSKIAPGTQTEAITRINARSAATLGIEAVKGIAEVAPNFYMPDYGSRMTSSIYVRGVGTRIDQPVVGLRVDNIPLLNKDAYDFDIVDIASIEVLRGAQAVLNGRNTMGGQIDIRTLSPIFTRGWRASASYGRGNTVSASASYYGGVNDKVGLSLAAGVRHTDGFYRNEYTGRLLDWENSGSIRQKTVWKPSARFSLINTLYSSFGKQGGYPYAFEETGRIAYNDTCSYRRTFVADGITVAYAGKRVVVNSLTSVQYLDDDMRLDQDFLPADYFTLRQKRREWTFTEDLFVRGRRSRYSWLGGVFAFYKNSDMKAPVDFYNTGIAELIEYHRNKYNPEYPVRWDSRQFTLGSDFKSGTVGVAVYHESEVRLGDWRLEVGLRLDIERNTLDYSSHCNTGYSTMHVEPDGSETPYTHTAINIADHGSLHRTFVEMLPKVTVSRNFSCGNVWLSFSKGYKAGGYNTQMFSDVLQQRIMSEMGIASPYTPDQIVSYDPEYSFNYELGMHLRPCGSVSAELNAFYISVHDQQLTTFPDGSTGRIMTNAGRTRSMGAEASLRWQALDNMVFNMAYGFTDARFRSYNDGRGDYRGKRVPYAPQNTLFASASWNADCWSFAGITPEFEGNVRGVGSIYWDDANAHRQPFYALVGASVMLRHKNWSVQLWGRNISDTRFNTFRFVSMNRGFYQRGLPVTYGVTLKLAIN